MRHLYIRLLISDSLIFKFAFRCCYCEGDFGAAELSADDCKGFLKTNFTTRDLTDICLDWAY